jgi:hypothetical protein
MQNGECVLGLAKRDEYIAFQNYVVSITIKRRRFYFILFYFIFLKSDQMKQRRFIYVGSVW